MHSKQTAVLLLVCLAICSACGDEPATETAEGLKVETSGKEVTDLEAVPDAVIEAAMAARPDLSLTGAEHELRNGNEYYDVGGVLPDGSELELDMTLVDGSWTVVEVQRDVEFTEVPKTVRTALAEHMPNWSPDRIIEADQGGGATIYEFFRHLEQGEREKIEVRWQNAEADVLVDEWRH